MTQILMKKMNGRKYDNKFLVTSFLAFLAGAYVGVILTYEEKR